MMRFRRYRFLFALAPFLLASFFSACATKQAEEKTIAALQAKGGGFPVSYYVPLNLGNSWTYERDYLGEKGEVTISIVGKNEEGFFLDNQGGKLKITQFGLRDEARYLLMSPLETGNHWRVQLRPFIAEHFKIIEDDITVKVPAGEFEQCVIVRSVMQVTKKARMVNQITFAPKVGIIRTQTWLEDNRYRKKRQVMLSLKSYSFP